MAQSIKLLTLGVSSGHDHRVQSIRLHGQHRLCLRVCLSPPPSASPHCTCSLSKRKKGWGEKEFFGDSFAKAKNYLVIWIISSSSIWGEKFLCAKCYLNMVILRYRYYNCELLYQTGTLWVGPIHNLTWPRVSSQRVFVE